MHATAALMRTSEGMKVKESTFFAPASDSSPDRAANKQELVYTRMVSMGKPRFLGFARFAGRLGGGHRGCVSADDASRGKHCGGMH